MTGSALESPPARSPLLDATAGALAGCISRLVIGPLDVLKIRFQVQLEPIGTAAQKAAARHAASKYTGIGQALKLIAAEEGIQGLWRGTVPGLLLTVPYTAVQFAALQEARAAAQKWGLMQTSLAPAVSFVSGAVAGAAATVASYPFDLLRTTLAAQGEPKVYHSMAQAAQGIMKDKGFRGLYRGVHVTLLEIIPYAALQFGLYDAFTSAYTKARHSITHPEAGKGSERPKGDAWARFACGLAAGTLAKLATNPLDVAKKRYQVAGLQRSTVYGARISNEYVSSLRTVLVQIYHNEGIKGLYKGSSLSILKAAPAAAVTFAAYEFFIGYLSGVQAAATAGPRS